ncbi:MAG: hypothetical protein U0W40_12020 [Acidimicrobiia bacterium]
MHRRRLNWPACSTATPRSTALAADPQGVTTVQDLVDALPDDRLRSCSAGGRLLLRGGRRSVRRPGGDDPFRVARA